MFTKTKITPRPWLVLPIETKARELHGKMLLASVAAEHGWGVVMGSKPATRGIASLLPKGIFLEKSISPGRLKDIESLQKEGHRVSVCDEEGLLYVNLKWYEQRRLEKASFNAIDYFFAWGQQHRADTLSLVGTGNEKIVVSGNPRFDLLRTEFRGIYERSANEIRKKYGRIILINSNFLFVNNGAPEAADYISYLKSIDKITDEENEETWRKLIRLGEENMRYFLDMLPRLSREFPDHTIVVRPHPSEKDATWRERVVGLPNARVLFEGSANEWIVAAEVSIQNNCTTAVEAFLLDRLAITYRPYKDDTVEFVLPNGVSFQAHDLDDLVALTNTLITARESGLQGDMHIERERQLELAKHYLANIEGPLASETIMRTLENLALQHLEAHFPIRQATLLEWAVGKLKTLKRSDAYTHKKFPGIKHSEVKEILNDFQRASGRFADVKIVQVHEDGFCIYKE